MLPVSAFGLGTWQVKRKIWKESLIQELKMKTKYPAIDFPEELEFFFPNNIINNYNRCFIAYYIFIVKMNSKILNIAK